MQSMRIHQPRAALRDLQAHVRVPRNGILDTWLLDNLASGIELKTLEMVLHPGIVDVFDAVDDGSAHEGHGVLVRVGMGRHQARKERDVEREGWVCREVGAGEVDVAFFEGRRGWGRRYLQNIMCV